MSANSRRRRDRHDIIADILRVCRDGVSTRQMLQDARICHTQLKKITPGLIEHGLLLRKPKYLVPGRGHLRTSFVYRTTGQGLRWLRHYRLIKERWGTRA